MGLFHVAYNGYVWKTLFLYRHPERSRGIFLAHRYSAVCGIAEKGKPFAKGARKSRVQGRFLAALEMTAWGWISAVSYKVCAGKMFFPNRHPERSRGIFFVGGKRASVRQRGTGNTASQERKRSLPPKPSIYLFP